MGFTTRFQFQPCTRSLKLDRVSYSIRLVGIRLKGLKKFRDFLVDVDLMMSQTSPSSKRRRISGDTLAIGLAQRAGEKEKALIEERANKIREKLVELPHLMGMVEEVIANGGNLGMLAGKKERLAPGVRTSG